MSDDKIIKSFNSAIRLIVLMNSISAVGFFIAFYYTNEKWYLVACVVNVFAAVFIVLFFKRFLRRFKD